MPRLEGAVAVWRLSPQRRRRLKAMDRQLLPVLAGGGALAALGWLCLRSDEHPAEPTSAKALQPPLATEALPPLANEVQRQRDYKKGELWTAAQAGNESVVRDLLRRGADPNDADEGNRAALAHAAANGREGCVTALLEGKADVNRSNKWDETPLYKASYAGHQGCVTLLLTAGADPSRFNVNGRTPLMAAAWDGRSDMCTQLLLAGADPNAKSQFTKKKAKHGDTALYWAQTNGHDDCVAVLLAAGAK